MKARSVARGGLMTGVSMLLLGMGTLFEIAGGAAAVLAALVPALFFLKGDTHTGRLVYLATSLLAALILPDKFFAAVYALVLGLYTVLKFEIDKRRRPVRVLCKAALVAAWAAASAALVRFGLVEGLARLSPLLAGGLFVGWACFLAYYDFCLTRIFAGLGRWLSRFH